MKYSAVYNEYKIQIIEVSEEHQPCFPTKREAEIYGRNLEMQTCRKEFRSLSLDDLDTEHARFLEQKIWGQGFSDFQPGMHIEKRKQELHNDN